jgi:trk system potassium uptake protein TrkH
MTLSSFVILSRKRELSPERINITNSVFSLPKNFVIDKFIVSVIKFTIAFELAGAVFLFFLFKEAGDKNPLWSSVFHSVSAFCTAGFSLYDNSFESFRDNFWLNFIISALSFGGAVGFIVFVDICRKIKGETAHVTLTSKIILHSTFWLSIVGTIVFFLAEPSVQQLAPDEKLTASFFQVMSALTTVGFNTIPISSVARASIVLLSIMMIIGASPSGTGGGIKSTTFSAMIGVMKSTIKGNSKVLFWDNEIPHERILTATSILCFYVSFLLAGVYLLELTESFKFEQIVFEAASALGTVGLSMGITGMLNCPWKGDHHFYDVHWKDKPSCLWDDFFSEKKHVIL